MKAEGMPSLRVQTVWVYSVRGLLASNALAGSDRSRQQVDVMMTLAMWRRGDHEMAHMARLYRLPVCHTARASSGCGSARSRAARQSRPPRRSVDLTRDEQQLTV